MITRKPGFINASIMIVDDTPENLRVLSKMLHDQSYEVRPVPSGRMALHAARNKPPDLFLLDINMPEMNGYELCEIIKGDRQLKEIPVIFISALSETLDKVTAFEVGGVDYITKPYHLSEVLARVETHLHLSKLRQELQTLVNQQVKEISDSQMATIIAMARLAQSRDDDTGKHLDRIMGYCDHLAKVASMSPKFSQQIDPHFCSTIGMASILHDIGKVAIPDKILLKEGQLTDEEMEVMKTHTTEGANTLRKVAENYRNNNFVQMGIAITELHHERWDGTGYPHGLSGVDIPLSARIVSIADVYDALKSERCYKEPYDHIICVETIQEGAGTQFDPDLVEIFLEHHKEMYEIWTGMQ